MNPVIGDIPRNTARILEMYSRAQEAGAELVVFPELALIGCPAFDLLARSAVVQACMSAIDELAAAAGRIPLVLGAPYLDNENLYNAALVLADGQIRHRVDKRYIGAHPFLHEDRYFTAGENPSVSGWEYAGEKIAFYARGGFDAPPVRKKDFPPGTSLVIVPAATPFYRGIRKIPLAELLAQTAHCPCIMVDLTGGNGEYIFDGGSIAAFPGKEVMVCARFAEELRIVDTVNKTDIVVEGAEGVGLVYNGPVPRCERDDSSPHISAGLMRGKGDGSDENRAELYAACVFGLREYVRKSGFTTAVIGLSGGLDSAMLAVFAADALGVENTVGVSMPSRFSSGGSVDDAAALARTLGIRLETLPIEPIVGAFSGELAALFAGTESGLAEQNLQARIRGTLLMTLANKFSWLLLNTGNKSEAMTGYCTLYGDTNGAFSVIADIYKTELYTLARWINREHTIIPEAIIAKPPSAELAPGQLDSDSLPPYEVLDEILRFYLECGYDVKNIAARGIDAGLVRSIIALVERSEYKRRQAPPMLHLTHTALYSPRQVPLAARTVLFPEDFA
jgi:NAD+ synthase (glutamine-hydrolysing)